MANLSQQKRQRMLKFLKKLREVHKKDDDVLVALGEIESELNAKKYGLVWEQHEEAVDVKMHTHIPVFTEVSEREITTIPNGAYNFLLEGDNLHSLRLLEKTHKNQIDVIYIDPPYNTGNSLTYDDTRVGADDTFRHSKWLSFMDKRLKIAHNLLCNSGVIMLSIDDNEAYQLKLLMDEIFGEENLMGIFAVIKAEGGGMAKYVVKGHDLLLVYAKNLKQAHPLAKEKDIRGKRIVIDNVEYWIQEDAIRETFGKYGNLYYEDVIEKRGIEFKKQIDKGIENNEYILVPKDNGKRIIGKLRRIDEDYSKFYSVIKHLNADGVDTLKSLGLADDFDYPKPVSLVKEIIKGATFFTKHTPIILDFFAGSGTTAQAILELNKEDGKSRKFIMCTNNEVSAKAKLKFVKQFGHLTNYSPNENATDNSIENKIYSSFENGKAGFKNLVQENKTLYESYGICQGITYKRIKKIIQGYQSETPEDFLLFDKKLTYNNLDKVLDYKQKINNLIAEKKYTGYKAKITADSRLQLTAHSDEYIHHAAIPANLKYYRTDFIPKNDEFLSDVLMNHIVEMIQLEHGIKLDGQHYIMLLNNDEVDTFATHWDEYQDVKALYVSKNVLFTTKQNKLFKNVKIHIIPDYYFNFELKEAGEIW